jgi:hypothetical protein
MLDLDPPVPARRYEHAAAGDLLHLDEVGRGITRFRFKKPSVRFSSQMFLCFDSGWGSNE